MTEIPEHLRKSAEEARARAAESKGEDVAAGLGAGASGLGGDPFMPPPPSRPEEDSDDPLGFDGSPVRDGLDGEDVWSSFAPLPPRVSLPTSSSSRAWEDDLIDAGIMPPVPIAPPVPPLPPSTPVVAPAAPAVAPPPTPPAAPVAPVAPSAPSTPPAPAAPAAPPTPPPIRPPWAIRPGNFRPGNDPAARRENGAVAFGYVMERLEDDEGRYPGVRLEDTEIKKVSRRSRVAAGLGGAVKSLWNFGGVAGVATGGVLVGATEYFGSDGVPGELKYGVAAVLFGAGYAAAGAIKPAVKAVVREVYSDTFGNGRRATRRQRYDYEQNRRNRSYAVRQQVSPVMARRPGEPTLAENRSTVSGNDLMDLLSYGDVLRGQAAIDALTVNQNNPNTPKYIRELDALQKRFGIERIKNIAWDLGDELSSEMLSLGLGYPSVAGRSLSWAVWDLAKQSYLTKHPEESGEGYTLRDPMSVNPGISEGARRVTVDRQLGWEFDNLRGPALGSGSKYRDFPRKPDGSLSSRDYARLGEMLRRRVAPVVVPE